MVRIVEVHDLASNEGYRFYEHLKGQATTPPDGIRCNEKYIRPYYVLNVFGIIATTNHKTGAMHLPADDERHYVAWSYRSKEDFGPGIWDELWAWYEAEGFEHVAAYLAVLDLADFNPMTPPPKTEEFWEMVNADRPTEDAEMADVIEAMGKPEALTADQLLGKAREEKMDVLIEWLLDKRFKRHLPARLAQLGYAQVSNHAATDKLFKIGGRRQVAFALTSLSMGQRVTAVEALNKKKGADNYPGRTASSAPIDLRTGKPKY
jgi:hypothetical protein